MARLKNLGLRGKTFIFVGTGLTALIVLSAFFSLQTVNQGMEIASRERLTVGENIALTIDELVWHLRSETVYVASTLGDNWENVVTDSNEQERLISLQNYLQHHLKTFHEIEVPVFTALLDTQGEILQTEPFLEQKAGQSLVDIPAVGNVLQGGQVYIEVREAVLTGDKPTLSIVAPIKDKQGLLKGVLVVDIPIIPASFDPLLTRWGLERKVELLTENGFILASSVPSTGNEESMHWDLIHPLTQERLPVITEHPGNGDRKAHLVAFVPLEQVPWGVVMEQPKGEILELPWAMGQRILLIGVIAIVLAAGLIWGFTRQIISPIQRLATVAETFGTGNLEAEVPLIRQDEIGKLAQSFETMRGRLKQSLNEINMWNQELEQRVQERTSELEGLYEQLRRRDNERSDLLGKIITAQEEERRRIARELHDEISQTLTGLVMSLGSAEALLPDNSAARQRLKDLHNITGEAVEEVRRLILDLRPSLLDDLGLVAAISWYVENYLDPADVKTKLETHNFDSRLTPTTEITLFRVVQEAITNIVKHAQARTARICLQRTGSAITGTMEDDGIGFNMHAMRRDRRDGAAMGLLGMKERIHLLGGKLNVDSQPGGGTRIHFEIPWQEGDGE